MNSRRTREEKQSRQQLDQLARSISISPALKHGQSASPIERTCDERKDATNWSIFWSNPGTQRQQRLSRRSPELSIRTRHPKEKVNRRESRENTECKRD
ncbi:hypothetical protein RRG08_014235 [Elysia crispata]|uniref:Uncharacterized protein n=1 Tax=Elysia crispata TaxID=231223 RepID=A0AAE0XEG3_9GAST|nr:hypothetical protein RRG08_014235 [Elysia crispata]